MANAYFITDVYVQKKLYIIVIIFFYILRPTIDIYIEKCSKSSI